MSLRLGQVIAFQHLLISALLPEAQKVKAKTGQSEENLPEILCRIPSKVGDWLGDSSHQEAASYGASDFGVSKCSTCRCVENQLLRRPTMDDVDLNRYHMIWPFPQQSTDVNDRPVSLKQQKTLRHRNVWNRGGLHIVATMWGAEWSWDVGHLMMPSHEVFKS